MSVEALAWERRARCRYLVPVACMLPSAVLIAATACNRPQPRPGPAATVEPPPVCANGGLQFAAPYLPTDIALSPDGKLLAVADRGILTVRDAETLRVHRYLEPHLNAWKHVRFAEAGKVLLAETDDALHAEFDTTTWELRAPPKQEPGQDMDAGDSAFLWDSWAQRSEFLLDYSREFWTHVPDVPALGPGVIPTAFEFSAIDETGWTGQLRGYEQDLDALTLEQLRTVVATTAGEIRILDHGGKVLVQRPSGASAAIAKLQVTGGHLVAGTTSGEVIVLTRELAEVARAQVLQPGEIEDARLRLWWADNPKPMPPDSFLRFEYDPVAQRIFWLSTSLRLGVFDLKAKRSLAELPATSLPGAQSLAFLDTRTLAALSSGVLWVWDIASGQTKWHAAGPFKDGVLTGEPGFVLASSDGRLTLYRKDVGEVVRSVCILPDGCDAVHALHSIVLKPGPDGRHVLLLADPRGPQAMEFQVWSADLTERVQSIEIDDCSQPPPLLVATAGAVEACSQRFHATTFQPIPDSEDDEPLEPEIDTSFPLAYGGTLEVTEGSDMDGSVTIEFGADGFDRIAGKYYDTSPPRDAQRLHATQVAVAADGKLFALAGGKTMLGWSGPVQVWCTPVPGQTPLFKSEPPGD